MSHHSPDPSRYFRLKPLRVARVSEISESTAASDVAPEERVNFHIGNPLQDGRLSSAYLRILLDLSVRQEELADDAPESLLNRLGWDAADRPVLDFRGSGHQAGDFLREGACRHLQPIFNFINLYRHYL